MDPHIKQHLYICDICRRPRSKEFHRRYPAGQDYPRTHSVCLPPKKHYRELMQRTVRAMNDLYQAGKVFYQGLCSRNGLYIQVHHHHWHHNTLSEDDLTKAYGKFAERPRSPSFQEKPVTIRQKKQPASDNQVAHVAELTDGPTPAPYELPAYQSYADAPPAVSQKPVFRFQVSEDVS
ncbi:uncharacterized protein FMAN_15482 [Fusarium mangiferae]|uniref:Uncharacterized protein n=1 Tax=Fusarium mangiferae TaxID=192010 RepID=A0A1L7UF86_FUSMA|nr:uncharacterized protein FMAN_15482 [Fusarium mangiferae]CVL09318.1 uncharacterized protein FMAN_15482 [Fusarium mangiferae]